MRFSSAGLLSATLLVSQLAAAGTPASSPQQLGGVQAAVDFCSKMDPLNAKRIEREAKAVLPDMTDARVAAARPSREFKSAYQTIGSVLHDQRAPDARRLCGDFPAILHQPRLQSKKRHP